MPKGKVKGASARYPHGKSIRNPATYDALRRHGMSKSKAARISNSAFAKTGKRGRHHKKGK